MMKIMPGLARAFSAPFTLEQTSQEMAAAIHHVEESEAKFAHGACLEHSLEVFFTVIFTVTAGAFEV